MALPENNVIPSGFFSKLRKLPFSVSVYLSLAVIFFVALIIAMPILTVNGLSRGLHDVEYHLALIRAIDNAWQNGHFGSPILPLIAQDYGYGSGLFYSMIPASLCVIFINLFGMSVQGAIFLEILLLYFISGTIVYFFLRRIFGNRWFVAVCAALYIAFPYFITNIYLRFAFSEIFMMLPIPLIAWGLYELFMRGNYKAFFPLFITGCLISIFIHFALTLYTVIFVAIFIAINYKKIFQKYYFAPVSLAASIIACIGSLYYIPMFANFFDISRSNTMGDGTVGTLTGQDSGGSRFAWLSANNYDISDTAQKSNTVTVFLLAILLIAYMCIYFSKPKAERTANEKQLLIISSIIILFSSVLFPWQIAPKILMVIEFPTRLFVFGAIIAIILAAYILNSVKKKHIITLTAVMLMMSAFTFNTYASERIKGELNINNVTDDVSFLSESHGGGSGKTFEYGPRGISVEYVRQRLGSVLCAETNASGTYELAHNQSLNQLTFSVSNVSSNNSKPLYYVLRIPYDVCDGIKVHQFYRASHDVSSSVVTVNHGGYLRINFYQQDTECKFIITYPENGSLDNYLKEEAFEFKSDELTFDASNYVRTGINYTADFDVTATCYVELPTLYYKGYEITYTTANGTYNLEPLFGINGFVEVLVAESGTISVKYTGGGATIAARVLASLGLIIFIGTVAAACFVPRRVWVNWANSITVALQEPVRKEPEKQEQP